MAAKYLEIPPGPLQQDTLKNILEYVPETGEFFWKVKPSAGVSTGAKAGYQQGGYVQIRIARHLHYAHRLAFLYMDGAFPPEAVDHINGLRSDNRWANLRRVTSLQNCRNAARSKNNSSGITGVVWDRRKGMWMARIMVDRKEIFLGYFEDIPTAATARKAAEAQYQFHPNHGRP